MERREDRTGPTEPSLHQTPRLSNFTDPPACRLRDITRMTWMSTRTGGLRRALSVTFARQPLCVTSYVRFTSRSVEPTLRDDSV